MVRSIGLEPDMGLFDRLSRAFEPSIRVEHREARKHGYQHRCRPPAEGELNDTWTCECGCPWHLTPGGTPGLVGVTWEGNLPGRPPGRYPTVRTKIDLPGSTGGMQWNFDFPVWRRREASREVEQVINGHAGVVRSAVVWTDDIPTVFIETRPGTNRAALQTFCRGPYQSFIGSSWIMNPPEIVFGPLPTNPDGTMDRARLPDTV
jgi:hypothetical protein